MKRNDEKYTVEKTVETMKILEVLEIEPATIETIISRVGFIPVLNRKLKADAARRILITLNMLGYVAKEKRGWLRTHKSL